MPLKIVFMGTPDFAVPCLAKILALGHRVVGVYSQPDKPKGRGYQLAAPPVKQLALENGLPVYQPVKMRDGTVREQLKALAPDLMVVVAYGRLLPPDILEIPSLGCVNVHASLLPRLRGAAPIQWSIIRDEGVTGVTTMYMAEGIDTGDMILKKETPIGHEETTGQLFERLSLLGAETLAETLALIEAGAAPRTPQDDALATFAPLIEKKQGELDFTRPARELCCLIRGLSPAPGAFTRQEGKLLKVHQAREAQGFSGAPGEILSVKKRFIVGCGQGAIELSQVQPEGKKPMDGSAYACGKRLEAGQKLTAV